MERGGTNGFGSSDRMLVDEVSPHFQDTGITGAPLAPRLSTIFAFRLDLLRPDELADEVSHEIGTGPMNDCAIDKSFSFSVLPPETFPDLLLAW